MRRMGMVLLMAACAVGACERGGGRKDGGGAGGASEAEVRRDTGAEGKGGAGKDGGSGSGEARGKGKGAGRGRGGPVAVRAELVEAKELPEVVEVVAVLSGRRQAEVYSRVAGKVSYIGPAEGQRVKEGEVLFRVDRSDPGETFVPTPVVSPIAGWVGRWLVTSLGAQVTPQDPVATIVDDQALRATVLLPTDQWLRVSDKTPVRVSVGREQRPATIKGIARAAESTASRGTVTIEIDNADHKWKAGMVSVVAFDLDVRPRLVVPAKALSITDQGAFVFVVKDGKAERTRVKFSVIDNDRVELVDGVAGGVTLVTDGVNQVGDGAAVKVVDDAARSAQR